MEKVNFTPEESFTVISKAIANFKMNYKDSAKIFLLWGWILSLASLSSFIILKYLHSNQSYEHMEVFSLGNWVIFILIGFIIHYFTMQKIDKEKKVYSYLDSYINIVWQVAIAAFIMGTIICIILEINPPSVMLLIAGFATTISGLFIKYKPIIIGGIAFFIFSIASTFVQNEYIALLTFAAIVIGYLIPGYFLKAEKE